MDDTIHFLGISGSLRKGSYNTSLLNAAAGLLPEGVTMETISISDIPHYNADLDIPAAAERPGPVKKLRDAMARADGLLFVSPEYNYSIPGTLKNAIDWASRGQDSPMLQKCVAVMGATPGLWGTVRMQTAFLSVFQFLNMKPVLKPEILVNQADKKFDESGKLTDETSIDLVRKKLEALKQLCLQNKKS
jgi:chromate reductase, NAD(P)H dehydrogenase (quinone)